MTWGKTVIVTHTWPDSPCASARCDTFNPLMTTAVKLITILMKSFEGKDSGKMYLEEILI